MEKSRLESLKQLLDNDPGDAFTRYAIGLEYLSMKDTGKAIKILEELVAEKPQYLPVYYQLGKAYESNGEIEKARVTYQKGVDLAAGQNDIHTMDELQQALEDLY